MTQRFLDAAKYVMNQINSANLSGAIDVIVVEQEDGSLVCSPFHVRFGKLGTLVAAGRPVDVLINGVPVPSFRMKLGQAGEAFFVEQRLLEVGESTPSSDDAGLLTTPITSDIEDEAAVTPKSRSIRRTQSLSDEVGGPELEALAAAAGGSESVSKRWRRLRRVPVDDGEVVKSEGEDDAESLPQLMSCKSDSLLTSTPDARRHEVEQDSLTWEWGELPVEAQSPNASGKSSNLERRASFDPCVSFHLGNKNNTSECDTTDVELVESGVGGEAKQRRRKVKKKRRQDPPLSHSGTEEGQTSMRETEAATEPTKNDDEVLPVCGGDSQAKTEEAPETSVEVKAEEEEEEEKKEMTEEGNEKMPEPKEPSKEDAEEVKEKADEKPKEEEKAKEEEKGKAKVQEPAGGIYLSELIDRPELHELYVYGRSSDGFATPASRDGAASPVDLGYRSDGEGSASVSPVPVNAGQFAGSGGAEDDAYRIRNIQLSLCGGLAPETAEAPGGGAAVEVGGCAERSGDAESVDSESFRAHMVLYEEFCQDPDGILKNPNLVVLLNGRYYNWTVAAPLLVSSLVYQCELPPKTVDRMIQKHMVKKETKRRGSMFARWTSWGRRPQPVSSAEKERSSGGERSSANAAKIDETAASSSDGASATAATATDAASAASERPGNRQVFHIKSLRLPSDRLRELGLKPGANTIEYRVVSQFQGTARCHAQIFLWHWTDRLVISDIDGTITQSDVMGQLGPFIGRDVSQRGVAGLYSRIVANRFRVLYLSSRAIGQAHWTRSYLESVVQERGARLPPGPLLLSPTSLLFALVREIRNRPEDFKIPCLRDVRSLFPQSVQPFFAGFGNKINDVRAYEAVGVPQGRIFVVNTEGDLRRHGLHHYRTNYSTLGELVDHFFPEAEPHSPDGVRDHEEFSHFTYWRQPPPELGLDLKDDEKGAEGPKTV